MSGLLHRQSGEFVVYGYDNVNLVVWENTISVDALHRVDGVHARRHRELGKRLSLVSVLTARVGFPSAQVRTEIHALQVRWRPAIGCFVAVLEADGMWRSALRGFLTAVQSLAPESDGRLHLASSLGGAAAWLVEPHARVTGVKLERTALKQALEQARRAGAPQSATLGDRP